MLMGLDMPGRKAANRDKELVNVGIPKDVNERFQAWCDRRHVIKRDALASLIVRFLLLDEPAQTAFTFGVDAGMELAYANVLESLARELRGGGKAGA